MFITRDRETGTIIDEFMTLEEAEDAIRKYEATDEKEGTYSENFYEIYNEETAEIIL